MSPKLRRMSGGDAVYIFCKLGFSIVNQRGSHVKLVRVTKNGDRQILTIPNHKELDTGTLQSIVRQASRFIDPLVLRQHFYSS